jgi:type II secretory pathway pseudopilin PulG
MGGGVTSHSKGFPNLHSTSSLWIVRKTAFTLAETLITLGTIGVVAALTLPSLIQNYQEKALVNQLKVAYSILSQAYTQALEEHGPSKYWDIGARDTKGGADKLYQIMKPYFSDIEDCGISTKKCFYTGTYKALFNNSWVWQPNTLQAYSRARLKNGISLAFWSNGTGCQDDFCGKIYVDINGNKGPNQAGVDYFGFRLYTNKVVPDDLIGKTDSYGNTCKYKDTSNKNGSSCTAWVLLKENMDYRRRDIKAEWMGTSN